MINGEGWVFVEPLLTATDAEFVPGLAEPWRSIFFDAANSAVQRLAPCLVTGVGDEGRRAEAKLIVLRAIERVRQTPAFVKSQTAGPFSVTYVTGGRGLLDVDDRAALTALCERDGLVGARGAFPPAVSYDRLFVPPPSRGWW